MTYTPLSDTRLVHLIVGNSLWLYDVETPVGGELLRISISTEKVVLKLKMPAFNRPAFGADSSGLFFGASNQGEPDVAGQGILFFIPVGSNTPDVLLRQSTYTSIETLCYDGQRAWAQVFKEGERQITASYLINGPGRSPVKEKTDPFNTCASWTTSEF
jgi:hypothetical protein